MWSIVSSLARSLTSRVKSSYASVLTELRQKYAPTNAQVRCVRLPDPPSPLTFWAHLANSSGVGSGGPNLKCEIRELELFFYDLHIKPERGSYPFSVSRLKIYRVRSGIRGVRVRFGQPLLWYVFCWTSMRVSRWRERE